MNELVTQADGTKVWLKDGELHRDDGPALIFADGKQYWYQNGVLHREDGPAIEYEYGAVEYWLFDQRYSYEEWNEKRFWIKASDGVVK